MKRINESHRSSSVDRQRGSVRALNSGENAAKDAHSDDDEARFIGVRYITEDLIKKLTKQDNLALVLSLNLSSAHGDKYFKYIENLDKCDRLQVLNLSNNSIEKIEKLEKLHKLRELHLSNNRIRKIEGLEHMANLQILNFASNNIEQVPFWLAKKLRSLQKLNLQKNKIFSLHELAKLKLLKNLSELILGENPVSDLAHYRLFLVFHLRSLESLDGQLISEQERALAHQRFHAEEVERLEQELEERGTEIKRLQEEKAVALMELEQQEKLQQTLKHQCQEQQCRQEQLEMELDTKSELLKQKTSELTRACQKQYELEQELAFHKIDAKFEPLPYYSNNELQQEHVLSESPYIGKARHKRNMATTDSVHTSQEEVESRRVLAEEERLQQLRQETEHTERRLLRASEELQKLEEAASQKRISEAEKEHLRQQLQMRIQKLSELQQEAKTLERQLDRQNAEMSQTQGEMDKLQSLLHTMEPEDPRHAHVKAQLASKSQLLAIMSRKQSELEGRLDDMLTRIVKETQEIKDLEQQLTDGQIAANEILKKDLEDIISGLQEYLREMKDQARRDKSDCLYLKRERDALQHLLQDREQQLSQLRETTQITERTQEKLLQHQEELQALRRENASLRVAQDKFGAYESKLESQLRGRDTECDCLKEELGRLHRLSQLEHSALQAELQKERQAKENALAQLQLAAERELENTELLQQLSTLQREKGALMEEVSVLQDDLQQLRRELLCPKLVTRCLNELKRNIATGSGRLSTTNEVGDLLGKCLAELQEELHCTVSAALKDRDEAQKAQDKLTRELSSLRYQLQNYEQKYKRAREAAVQARATERYEGEAELRQLKEDLQEAQDQQYLMLQRLQEAESERDHLLSELEEQDKQMKAEDTLTRKQVESLDLELQELRKSFTTADQMAVKQLNAAKDKIRSLHSTVHKISQERAEDVEELEESKIQAAQAMRDLKKAEQEIQVLQTLLQDRVHVLDEPSDSFEVPHSSINQPDLARLKRALNRQQSQTRRLQDQLTHAIEDNNGNLEELIEEIEALRDTLLQQSNYLSRFGHAPHNGGNWHYVPPYQNPASLDSQVTQDSGLGSQHIPSTDRGLRYRGRKPKETRPSSSMGYWVYSPHPNEQPTYAGRDQQYRNSDGESDADGVRESQFTPPPGSVIYTMPPDGAHLPPGTVIYAPPVPGLVVNPGAVFYGPPPEGVRLVYGPPPSGLHIPLIPNGTLFCNVPGHLNMEHSLREAERSLKEQVSGKEVLEQELLKLEEQRSELQIQLKELRRAVGRLQRHRRLLESSVSSAEEESVMGEVKCAEKTLLKRRSELRESEHLLLEAEADLKDTRAKTKDALQRYNEVKRQLKETERKLEETERQTKQQHRDLQDELKDLQRRKQDEETTLQNIEKRIADRDTELQGVTRNLERESIKLENLQKELRETQCHEAKLLMSYRDSEEIVNQRRNELEHLNTQLHLAKEEQSLLGRKLEQWREEEGVMRTNMEKSRFGLVGVLRQGEEETHSLQKRIKELSVDMQDLSVQKGELDSQLSERKRKLALYKKEEQKEKETLQKLRSVISKHKEDLKRVLDRIQLESGELEQVKYQHKQILDQLEKSQENLLQVRMDLQEVQRELEEQQRERERQRRLQEEELLTLKEQADAAAAQRSNLLEQCANLEARRTQANRCLETAEEGAQKAEANLLKLQDDLTRLKQEHSHAQCLREELSRDSAVIQKQLQEKTEEMNKLKEQVSESKLQLDEMRKEVEDARQKLCDLAKQQREQKAVFQDKIQRRQQKVDKLEQQLKELEAAVARKQAQYKKEEDCLKTQQQQSLELEELQRQQQQKLQAQIQVVEEALAQRVEKMEQVTAAVEELEEKRSFLRADQKQCALLQDRVAQLEQDLAECEAKLWARTEEQRDLREELETCRSRIQLFQQTLNTDRCGTEVWRHGEEENRLGEIKDSVCSLRAEVKAELDSGMKELEFHPAETESFEVDTSWNVGQSTYKNNDDQWRGDALREKLMQHEDHLKAQLRKTVFSQQEALSLRRQQTEGSIQGLRRRVDKLDQLLSKSGHDSPYLNDSELVTKYTASNADSWREQRRGEHTFKAVRLDPSIPEKDQVHLLSQVY